MAGSARRMLPSDERPFGEVTFNYESFDGRYVLGTEPWRFETSWSQASIQSIHMYNDPAGIKGIAIAENVMSISQIDQNIVNQSDFTSRNRTPRIGQFVIIENSAGYFAAIEILSINASHIPSQNAMTFRYAILTDQSTDFARYSDNFGKGSSVVDDILKAANEAQTALTQVRGGDDFLVPDIGIGHNRPPSDFALTELERLDALAAVQVVRVELANPTPSLNGLSVAAQAIAKFAKKVALWLTAKTDLAVDEFAKTLGKAAAVLGVGGVAAWVALNGKLTLLATLLASFQG
jgi:hypothetical protein